MSSSAGFGSNEYKDRNDEKLARLASYRIWKKLFSPEHQNRDPHDPYRVVYQHHSEQFLKEV